ncbi:GM13815 [Drosophila sechellia]|uniref:GM13815 n=1 Tax=Drosophila sechellia TaxID=7238 RepID=B4HUY0_DROSE|nr:GM13815 [Drosophila sechellia]
MAVLWWCSGCVEAARHPTSSWSDGRTRTKREDELPSGSNQIQMSSKNARRAGHFSQHRVTRGMQLKLKLELKKNDEVIAEMRQF